MRREGVLRFGEQGGEAFGVDGRDGEASGFDGDYIFVTKRAHADDGAIVVAMIEGGATVKRIYREGERWADLRALIDVLGALSLIICLVPLCSPCLSVNACQI